MVVGRILIEIMELFMDNIRRFLPFYNDTEGSHNEKVLIQVQFVSAFHFDGFGNLLQRCRTDAD